MPTPSTLPIAASDHALHRAPRRPTTMDRVRVRHFLERIEKGEDELDAFWAIVSDPGIGYSRWRGQTERPAEIKLRRKLASLLQRAAPELVERARDLALARLGRLSDPAVAAVSEVVYGDFKDPQAARARLDAARVVLGSIGVREQAPATATANVNLSLGDGLKAMRHAGTPTLDVRAEPDRPPLGRDEADAYFEEDDESQLEVPIEDASGADR